MKRATAVLNRVDSLLTIR